jgi:hypothetical protein
MDISRTISTKQGHSEQTDSANDYHRMKGSDSDCFPIGAPFNKLNSNQNINNHHNVLNMIGKRSSQSGDSCHSDQENIPPYSSINKNKSIHSNSMYNVRTSEKRDLNDSGNSYIFVKRHHVEGSEDRTNVCSDQLNNLESYLPANQEILPNKDIYTPADYRELTNKDASSLIDCRLLTNKNDSVWSDYKELTNQDGDYGTVRPDQVDSSLDVHAQSCTTWDPYISHIVDEYSADNPYVLSECDFDSLHRSYDNTTNQSLDSIKATNQAPHLKLCDEPLQSCELLQLDHKLHGSYDESYYPLPWQAGLHASSCSLVETDDPNDLPGGDAWKAAILDLVTCEQRFIDIMQHGIQQFSRPLRHCVLSRQQHTTLFQNIEKVGTIGDIWT